MAGIPAAIARLTRVDQRVVLGVQHLIEQRVDGACGSGEVTAHDRYRTPSFA